MGNKIIKFPVDKVKDKNNSQDIPELPKGNPQKLFGVSLSLALIAFSLMFINGSDVVSSPAQNFAGAPLGEGRVIASISALERNLEWEHALAKRLSQRSKRGVAGRKNQANAKINELTTTYGSKYIISWPSSVDGTLKLLVSEGTDKVHGIEKDFIDSDRRPNSIEPIAFAKQYKSLWIEDTDDIEVPEQELEDVSDSYQYKGIVKEVELVHSDGKKSTIIFYMNYQNQLMKAYVKGTADPETLRAGL